MGKADMNGSEPKAVWSLNLNTTQLVLGNVVKLITVAVFVWGMVQWQSKIIFTAELERFHKEAVPQIERMIDSRVELQEAQGAAALSDRLDEINQRLARIEGQLTVSKARDDRQDAR